MVVEIKINEDICEYVDKNGTDKDLLLNKALKEAIPESMLVVCTLHTHDKGSHDMLIPKVALSELETSKTEPYTDTPWDARKLKEVGPSAFILSDSMSDSVDMSRFYIQQYQYIGRCVDDVVLNLYVSRIDLNDTDTGLLKLLKTVMNDTINVVEDETHKYRLTQTYSRVRRMNETKEDKSSFFSKLKLLESFTEGLYIRAEYRDDKGKIISKEEKITF